jgi:hypothetical protein
MAINRYKGQPLPILIKFSTDPLVPYGKKMSDITDVSMNLKKNISTDADDAYLEKKESVSSGVTVDDNSYSFQMNLTQTDYTNLLAGVKYYLVLAVQISGYTDYIELQLNENSKEVYILADTNRN